jgi:type II secretory pathway pseudopilin PulG
MKDFHTERPRTRPTRRRMPPLQAQEGFSLIEMLVSVVVLMAVMGAALSLMNSEQKSTQTQQLKGEMYGNLRGATELMTQEIGQAGLVSLPGLTSSPVVAPTLAANITASTVAQTVAVNPAGPPSPGDSMFQGEQLLIDTGPSQELVTLTAPPSSNGIKAIFSNSHTNGAPITVLGTSPGGVIPNSVAGGSDATHLRLFGDINSDGTLAYVHFDCDPTAGTLSRSLTIVNPTTTLANVSENLLNNLIANPGGTPCFQYTTQSVTISGTTYTFVTNVAITLSVQTSERDPQSGQFLAMTKSLLNVAPRNVLMGWELANANPPVPTRLQPTPPNLPLSEP